MMKRLVLLLAVGLFMLSGCAKKEVKAVSSESITAQEAFAVVESVRNAFVTKDMPALRRVVTEDGMKDVFGRVGNYDTVEMTFTPRWVEIDGSNLHVNVAWKSTWTISGKKVDERGMAVFVMDGRPLKVTRIQRSNPFQTP